MSSQYLVKQKVLNFYITLKY